MPEQFDPAWEYWCPDEEVFEGAFDHTVEGVAALGLEGEYGESIYSYTRGGTNFGFRCGSGNPDRDIIDPDPAPFRIGPDRPPRRDRRARCQRCDRGFAANRNRYVYCMSCLPVRGRPPIPETVCVQCGCRFTPKTRRHFRFCSPVCGSAFYTPKKVAPVSAPKPIGRPRTLFNVPCARLSCEVVFRPKERGQKYCSNPCRFLARTEGVKT